MLLTLHLSSPRIDDNDRTVTCVNLAPTVWQSSWGPPQAPMLFVIPHAWQTWADKWVFDVLSPLLISPLPLLRNRWHSSSSRMNCTQSQQNACRVYTQLVKTRFEDCCALQCICLHLTCMPNICNVTIWYQVFLACTNLLVTYWNFQHALISANRTWRSCDHHRTPMTYAHRIATILQALTSLNLALRSAADWNPCIGLIARRLKDTPLSVNE